MEENCESCRFSVGHTSLDLKTGKPRPVLSCHFNPPTYFLEGSRWPFVSRSDWCGKFDQEDRGYTKPKLSDFPPARKIKEGA